MPKSNIKRTQQPRTPKGLYKIEPTPGHNLTEGEKEMFAIAAVLAEKIHYAGMTAAIAFFEKLDFEEFKELCRPFDGEIRPDAYAHFMKLFYEAYCNGHTQGKKNCGSDF